MNTRRGGPGLPLFSKWDPRFPERASIASPIMVFAFAREDRSTTIAFQYYCLVRRMQIQTFGPLVVDDSHRISALKTGFGTMEFKLCGTEGSRLPSFWAPTDAPAIHPYYLIR
ncbi:hypothetical protein AVEN_94668-1 [Araneus ventricosus]|uniref:Uncharacterized protein n=1 Tax=Araneus ventricosus TaxID=182803 RepID=A0A4Y2Q9E5_ARAVE|nr:hypothetical protein AVEN_94668-1 [Araneus ventricosus]